MTKFSRKFYFFVESFTLNEIWELEENSLPTAAFREDINMFSTEFREGFGLWLWLYNKALTDQLVRSIRENIWTSAFRTDLTSLGPYFKTSIRIFSRIDLTIGQ